MIKKFEAFSNSTEKFISFVKEAFVDFIDDNIFDIHKTDNLVYMKIYLPFKCNNFSNIEKMIDMHKKQTEIIEEIKVAILRIKDEFGIEPSVVSLRGENKTEDDDLSYDISYYSYYVYIMYKTKDLI